jgi:hypothetical protein
MMEKDNRRSVSIRYTLFLGNINERLNRRNIGNRVFYAVHDKVI